MKKKLKHILAFALAFMASTNPSFSMTDDNDTDLFLSYEEEPLGLDGLSSVNSNTFSWQKMCIATGLPTIGIIGCNRINNKVADNETSNLPGNLPGAKPVDKITNNHNNSKYELTPKITNVISYYDAGKNGSDITKMSFCNAGNTCYINTFLQTVFQFPNLVKLFYDINEGKIEDKFWNNDKDAELTNLLTNYGFDKEAQLTILNDDSLYRSKTKEEKMSPLCALLYKTVQNADLAKELSSRITGKRQQIRSINFLKGMHKLVKTVVDTKKLTFDQWVECCKLMGHTGQTGVADDFWELATSSVREYHGLVWGVDESGKQITCPSKSVVDFVLLNVFDKPLDIAKAVNDEFNQLYTAKNKEIFRNSLRAGLGFVCVKIPSYLADAPGEKGTARLVRLLDTFEQFTLQANGTQEIWVNYNTKVEKAVLNLKAITMNYPGHWIAYTKHGDQYLKCNDGNISQVSKKEVVDDIIKNPVGTNLYYAIDKAD